MRVVANDGDGTTTTRYYATGDSIHLLSVEFVHGLAAVANTLPALLAGLIAGLAVYWVTRARSRACARRTARGRRRRR